MGFLSFVKSMNPFRAIPQPKILAPERPRTEPREEQSLFNALVRQQLEAARRRNIELEDELRAPEVPRDEIDAYLHFGQWLPVKSTNVAAIQYDGERSRLQIEFLDKGKGPGFYGYDDVSIREAEFLARSGSKGGWVWDNLRVRGKGNVFAWKKPYQFLSMSTYQPNWMRSPATRKVHGEIAFSGQHTEDMKPLKQKTISWLLGKTKKKP